MKRETSLSLKAIAAEAGGYILGHEAAEILDSDARQAAELRRLRKRDAQLARIEEAYVAEFSLNFPGDRRAHIFSVVRSVVSNLAALKPARRKLLTQRKS